ncbi:MAG: putative RsbT co-antagonist protein rsbRA [Acidobacteria bacterium]|nr:putative RsbT co-antagonist protein rsbRA [Acidobacteriota bacterium]
MSDSMSQLVAQALRVDTGTILSAWTAQQESDLSLRNNLLKPGELQSQSQELLEALSGALTQGSGESFAKGASWEPVRELLGRTSRSRAKQGFTPTETATVVMSLKRPLLSSIQRLVGNDTAKLAEAMWWTTDLLDRLALFTMETYQKGREDVIVRQQQELAELSTPVVQLWDGILALPLIGTLDSARTQVVMESLLQAVVDTGSPIAIIDITGVPLVDTLVAQHLLKTVAAARLMGADCIISGIRPQIAQTIVHLGVELTDVITKATLADAFAVALARTGRSVSRKS